MNNIDDMLTQLCQEVKPNNKLMEEREAETNYSTMLEHHPLVYNSHVDPTKKDKALLNKTFNALKQRAEVSNLTDSFRPSETEEVRSNTTRSLATVSASFSRYSSILQAFV